MRPVYGVRSVLYHHQASSLNQIGRPLSRSCDRYNAVCVTVNPKDWDVDTCRVVAEVFKPGLHTGNTGGGRGTRGDILARLDRLFADVLTQKNIRVVEILEKFGEERVSILSHCFPDRIKHAAVQAFGLWAVFRRKGEIPPITVALVTPVDPYFCGTVIIRSPVKSEAPNPTRMP